MIGLFVKIGREDGRWLGCLGVKKEYSFKYI